MSTQWVLENAIFEDVYVLATYKEEAYVGRGYEGEDEYDSTGDTQKVSFYAKRANIRKKSGSGCSVSSRGPNNCAIQKLERDRHLGVDRVEDLVQAFPRDVTTAVPNDMEFLDDTKIRLTVETDDGEVSGTFTFVPE